MFLLSMTPFPIIDKKRAAEATLIVCMTLIQLRYIHSLIFLMCSIFT